MEIQLQIQEEEMSVTQDNPVDGLIGINTEQAQYHSNFNLRRNMLA